jgi:hypothetical protein
MTPKLLFAVTFATFLGAFLLPTVVMKVYAADSNTVSSTVVTDKAPPTASAPSVVVNNSDICKSGAAASIQTQVLGVATGITITDENCERIKLARSLYGMGMKVAAVSTLCRDHRVFDAMWMSGTPCPFMGKIGNEAKTAWENNLDVMPDESEIRLKEEVKQDAVALAAANKKAKAKLIKAKQERDAKRKVKEEKRANDEGTKHMWFKPIGAILMLLLI